MKKFEHLVTSVEGESTNPTIQKWLLWAKGYGNTTVETLEQSGWELVGIYQTTPHKPIHMFWKREVSTSGVVG